MPEMQEASAGRTAPAAGRRDGDAADLAIALRNEAIRLSLAGRFAESEAHSREALRLAPDDVDVMNELGVAIWRQGRAAEAEAIYRRACRMRPNDFRILVNMGLALDEQRRTDEAIAAYRRALELQSDSFDAQMALGIALSGQGHLDEAMEWLLRAYKLRPESAEALQNLGMNFARHGRLDEAIDYFEQALRRQPELATVHLNLAYALLARGDFERGWREHEWRLKCHHYGGYQVRRPFWNGDDLRGRTILLHADQGYGDVLQFVRFAALVKERGGQVMLLCYTPLVRLVARCAGVDLAFDGSAYLPDCHVHAPLMSLPAIFGTTLETIPNNVPYLSADPALAEDWRSEMARAIGVEGARGADCSSEGSRNGPVKPFLIGIAWQGNPAQEADRWRSFPLARFAPLAELPGVRLVSLQVDHGLDQLRSLNASFPVIELVEHRGRDFHDTAAIMSQLDLVISPCTSVAHLAGGLGARAWVALSTVSDWRWLTGREDSPWYPTVRLFRQTQRGDWDGVFHAMAAALKPELEQREGAGTATVIE
jgi:Flp pilus assembly protein TadD